MEAVTTNQNWKWTVIEEGQTIKKKEKKKNDCCSSV
jgi:hypothetical protein